MQDLITRLEAATEGSRELDAEIAVRIKYPTYRYPDPVSNCAPSSWVEAWDRLTGWSVGDPLPRYTRSIDAAMTLVPEGWRVHRMQESDDGRWSAFVVRKHGLGGISGDEWAEWPTPAIALTIAALKAWEQMK